MIRLAPALFIVCVPALATLTAGCGSASSNSDDTAGDAATDGSPALDTGSVADSTTVLDAGSQDSSDATIAVDASSTEAGGEEAASADAATDAPDDAPSLADVITTGPTTCTLQSGSRIKIRWYESDAGARIFDSMYDTMLDAPCIPGTTSDGKLRCLPITPYGAQLLFADPSCSTPIYPQSDFDCTTAPYVGQFTYAGSCAAPTVAVYKVGPMLADAGAVYQGNSANCTTSVFGSLYSFFSLSPVADSTFVEGTAGTATSGNYSIATVDFSDGARFCDTSAMVDTRTQIRGQSTSMPDGTYRMLPVSNPSSGFAESTCTTPATTTGAGSYSSYSCSPVAPTTEDVNQCTGAVTVRSIGAPIDGGWVTDYAADAAIECLPADSLPEGGTWNALSDPLSPSTFDLVETQPSGTGRVEDLTWATYGGFRFALPHQGYDSQLATTCTVTSSTAPTAACLPPTSFAGGGLYTDHTCTTPLNLVTMPSNCIPSGFPAPGTTAYVSGCPSPKIVHVGAPYTGVMWQKVGNTCNDVGFPDDSFWSTIDDIDPSTYPELTAVVE